MKQIRDKSAIRKKQTDQWAGLLMKMSEEEQRKLQKKNISRYIGMELSEEQAERIFRRYCYLCDVKSGNTSCRHVGI